MLLVLSFLALLLICFAIVMIYTRPTREDNLVEVRLIDIRNPRRSLLEKDEDADADEEEDKSVSAVVGRYILRYKFSGSLQTLLIQSHSKWTIGSFVIITLTVAGAFSLAIVMFFKSVPIALAGSLVGAMLPFLWLRRMRTKRLKDFGKALPDAVDLMARALRAGHSIQQTLELIAEQSPAPLCDEFAQVHQHQKFGMPFRDALLQMSQRIASKDLRFVITAILVQRETGGDLIDILDRTTTVIRDRVRVEGEIKTYTAQGRLTGWILSLLPVIMLGFISVASPGYTHILFTDPWGQRLLMAGCTMIVIGSLIIRKIVDVEM